MCSEFMSKCGFRIHGIPSMCVEVKTGKSKGLGKSQCVLPGKSSWVDLWMSAPHTPSLSSHLGVCQLEGHLVPKMTSVCQILRSPTARYSTNGFDFSAC